MTNSKVATNAKQIENIFTQSRENYPPLTAKDMATITHRRNVASWAILTPDGESVRSFKVSPVGSVCTVHTLDGPEDGPKCSELWDQQYYLKVSETEWVNNREASELEWLRKKAKEENSDSTRDNIDRIVDETIEWLDSEEGQETVENDEPKDEISYVKVNDNISIQTSFDDGELSFFVFGDYIYIDSYDPSCEDAIDECFSYSIDDIDKNMIINDLCECCKNWIEEPEFVAKGRKYRSSTGDVYEVREVNEVYKFKWEYEVKLYSECLDQTVWCKKDEYKWKLQWTNVDDEYIDFEDPKSLVL